MRTAVLKKICRLVCARHEGREGNRKWEVKGTGRGKGKGRRRKQGRGMNAPHLQFLATPMTAAVTWATRPIAGVIIMSLRSVHVSTGIGGPDLYWHHMEAS